MLKLELQYFGHLMRRTDSLGKTLMLGKIEGGRRRGWQRMRRLDGMTDSTDMSLSKLWEMVKDKEARSATVHGVSKGRTRLSSWTELNTQRGAAPVLAEAGVIGVLPRLTICVAGTGEGSPSVLALSPHSLHFLASLPPSILPFLPATLPQPHHPGEYNAILWIRMGGVSSTFTCTCSCRISNLSAKPTSSSLLIFQKKYDF